VRIHIADFCVESLRFKEKDMRHQLYLACRGYGPQNKEIANKILTASNIHFEFYTCKDDCAGAYLTTKVVIYEER